MTSVMQLRVQEESPGQRHRRCRRGRQRARRGRRSRAAAAARARRRRWPGPRLAGNAPRCCTAARPLCAAAAPAGCGPSACECTSPESDPTPAGDTILASKKLWKNHAIPYLLMVKHCLIHRIYSFRKLELYCTKRQTTTAHTLQIGSLHQDLN